MKQAPLLLIFYFHLLESARKAHVQQRFPKESTIELDLTCATACRIHNKRKHPEDVNIYLFSVAVIPANGRPQHGIRSAK